MSDNHPNSYPKLHNAAWPGVVGRRDGGEPGQGGLSRTSIHRARSLYLAYTKELTIVPQVVG